MSSENATITVHESKPSIGHLTRAAVAAQLLGRLDEVE